MNKNRITEIRNLIENEFDSRMEASVFSYILEKGIEDLAEVTDEEIYKVEGNEFMAANFIQALVRTAVKICKKYTPLEIMTYIRLECNFAPSPKALTLFKDDFTRYGWSELCNNLDADNTEKSVELLVIDT